MKKFVIIMVFAFLIIVLVAFNYVLLDNQNKISSIERLESDKTNSLSSLTTITRENETLLSKNQSLEEELRITLVSINTLNESITTVNQERAKYETLLNHKLNIVERLKVNIDTTLFQNIAQEFMDSIESGNFLAAHNLIYVDFGEKTLSLEKMKSHFNYEKGIYSINGFETVLNNDDENINGEIKFKMNVSVAYSKRENNENIDVVKNLLFYLTFDFDDFDNNWLIKDIYVLFPE